MKQQRIAPIHDLPSQRDLSQSNNVQSSFQSNQARQEQLQSTYTVQSGDSLWKIAATTLGDGSRYMELATLNGLANPNVLSVGQVLQLPSMSSTSSGSAHGSNDASSASTEMGQDSKADEQVRNLGAVDREKTLEFLDPLLASMLRQDRKRAQDIFSQSIQSTVPASKEQEPQRNLLLEAVEQYATDHPKRDGESWNGWCASLMFRFGKSTSGFRDGVNDAPSAIKAAHKSNIESTDPSQAPKGAFHWWDIGRHGHVGLDVSGGGTQVFMATRKLEEFFGDRANAIGLTSIAAYNQAISGGEYLGWSTDYVGGKVQEELLNEAP